MSEHQEQQHPEYESTEYDTSWLGEEPKPEKRNRGPFGGAPDWFVTLGRTVFYGGGAAVLGAIGILIAIVTISAVGGLVVGLVQGVAQ